MGRSSNLYLSPMFMTSRADGISHDKSRCRSRVRVGYSAIVGAYRLLPAGHDAVGKLRYEGTLQGTWNIPYGGR
jgi:hypothetical protein